MRTLTLSLVLLALLTAACSDASSPLAPPAAAPDASLNQGGAPLPIEFSYVSTACGFPVLIEQNGSQKFFFQHENVVVITSPGMEATLTNLENGKQMTQQIAGTLSVEFLETFDVQFTLRGRNLVEGATGGLVIAVGNWSMRLGFFGNFVEPLHGTGQLIDLCALLS